MAKIRYRRRTKADGPGPTIVVEKEVVKVKAEPPHNRLRHIASILDGVIMRNIKHTGNLSFGLATITEDEIRAIYKLAKVRGNGRRQRRSLP